MMTLRFINTRFLLAVIVFTILYLLSDLTLVAGSAEPTFPSQLATTGIIGVALALVLGIIFAYIPLSRRARIPVAWPALFIIQWFNNMLEGFFFTTLLTEFLFLAAALLGLLISFFHAVLAALVFKNYSPPRPLRTELQDYFNQRPGQSWLWRLALSAASFLPIFYTIGTIISPLVLPFYLSLEFGLRVPPVPVIISLELVRGFLYVIALLPIIATLRAAPTPKWLLIAVLLFVPGVATLLPNPTYPVIFRAIHGIEILIDCLLFSAVITYLLGHKAPSQNRPEP